jgi:hypothetical protein
MRSENYDVVCSNTEHDICRDLEDVLAEQRSFTELTNLVVSRSEVPEEHSKKENAPKDGWQLPLEGIR